MAKPSGYPDPHLRSEDSSTGLPRWVKVVGLVIAILILLLVVIFLLGGGFGGHRPQLHGLGQPFGNPDASSFSAPQRLQ
jgi:hypothetical protein